MTNNNNPERVNNHHSNGSGTLESRIVAALQDPAITTTDLATLIADAERGLMDAEKIAERMQQIALDPLQSPDLIKAREAAEFATFVVKRLNNTLPRLRAKHQALVTQQRVARWNEAADAVEANRNFLAAEFAELYPQFLNKLVELFQRVYVMNAEIDNLNGLAPSSESRRLESLNYRPLLANSKLLNLSGEPLWPPPAPPILPEHILQVPPHPGRDWAQAIDQRNRARSAEAERVAAYYNNQAKAREEREAKAARNGALL